MKLAAIYNTFDGEELLYQSIQSIYAGVDVIIIVWQDISNFGEHYKPVMSEVLLMNPSKVKFVKYDPIVEMGGAMNERAKRNLGLDIARDLECTHFLALDNDEFYDDFKSAKEFYINSGHRGSVCKLQTYFKKPTLMFDKPEDYHVPFIHELSTDTVSGHNIYPFYVDPTRKINEMDVIELPVFMHHFSWVRHDIMRKANNSSARIRINEGKILEDYNSPDLGEGYFLTNFNRKLKVVPDKFGLSKIFE